MPKKKYYTVKEVRQREGMTQKEFAESIGVSAWSVGQYERGQMKPSAEVAQRIYDLYGAIVPMAPTYVLVKKS